MTAMSAYFVMIREQTLDSAALADYGPRASLAAQGHPLKPLATYGTLDQLEGDPIEGAVILEFPDMAETCTSPGSLDASLGHFPMTDRLFRDVLHRWADRGRGR